MRATIEEAIDFTLPPELEAREPPEARGVARDQVRLLVAYKASGHIVHARFDDLPRFLRAGDLLVVNISATIPGALTARRQDGSEIALHLSTQLNKNTWVVEPRNAAMRTGETLELPEGASATVLVPYRGSWRLWTARLDLLDATLPYLSRWGKPIAYPYLSSEWPLEMYQTVYASRPGSAEMPSAGRPFSAKVITRLRQKGVAIASIVLHTGVSSLEKDEPPYLERYEVPTETVHGIRRAKQNRGRVIAVGTTVVRALESSVDEDGEPQPSEGWTDLVVTPARGVRLIDGLLTGFHEPRASHLAMLEAIAGRPLVEKSYAAALARGYLWHEFGDSHLIL